MFTLITDEYEVEGKDWQILAQALEELVEEKIVFLTLQWHSPIKNCFFIQSILDEETEGQINLEVALVENHHNYIYETYFTDVKDILSTVKTMYDESTIPDVSKWEFVGAFLRD